jgi:superfamily II DNA helicase RecQ
MPSLSAASLIASPQLSSQGDVAEGSQTLGMVTPAHRVPLPPASATPLAPQPDPHQVNVQRIKHDIVACSLHVWQQPSLRQRQLHVAKTVATPGMPDHVIACLRTGYGKSHIVRLLGAFEMGFTLIFIPLLTLSADLLAKFESADEQYGRVRTFHLDESFGDHREKYEQLLQLLHSTTRSDKDTDFVFSSPQFLVHHPPALVAVLHAAKQRILCLLVMNEAHLHVQHAEAFRKDCRLLTTLFFRTVFHPPNGITAVWFLATTATLPQPYVPSLGCLTTLRFPPRAIIRSDPAEFQQREIRMYQRMCIAGDYTKHGIPIAVAFLCNNSTRKVAIFTNSKRRSFDYVRHLEQKLDEEKCDRPINVLHLHGSLF